MASGRLRANRAAAAVAGGGLLLLIALLVALTRGSSDIRVPLPRNAQAVRSGDPFAWVPGREAQFVARATAGSAHVLFTKSPGGVLATAARVAAFRPQILAATRGTGIDPGLIEGIVFVESAGRPYVLAGADASSAAGLTQILASTGRALLGMHIDLARSRRALAHIGNASSPAAFARALRGLIRVDDRFSPRKALAATVRYLQDAQQRFGRADLAVVSYHMGIGNLQQVLDDYDGGRSVPYAQLYFDTAPDRHAAAYRLLSGFGDQSSLYYWRVLGAVQIMQLYRSDPAALRRLAALQNSRASTAAVLHPPDRSVSFADASALSRAYARNELMPLPRNGLRLGLSYSRSIGAGAARLHVPAGLYRGLRPPALDLLVALAARVRVLSGKPLSTLTVAGAVSDAAFQRAVGVDDPDALNGYTFSVARRYVSRGQAAAFQSVLDRLQALNLIAWTRGLDTIEVTVASDASHVIAAGV